MKNTTDRNSKTVKSQESNPNAPRCGLCGKQAELVKTECCGQWVCNDEGNYVLFSYARNSCSRNHRRFTLCGSHHTEGYSGDWQTCPECRESFDDETNEFYLPSIAW